MSEDFPQEAPLPPPEEQVHNEGGPQTEHNIEISSQADQHVDEPIHIGSIDHTDEGRVTDVETAHARAIAEDEPRTEAANFRGAAKQIDAFESVPEGNHDYDTNRGHGPNYTTDSWPDAAGRNRNKAIDELGKNPTIAEFGGMGGRGREFPYITEITGEEARKGVTEREYAGVFRDVAERKDRYAARLGDWAEVLEKHPPTEAYLKEHKLEQLSPQDLIRIEDNIGSDLKMAERWSSSLTQLEAKYNEQLADLDDAYKYNSTYRPPALPARIDSNMREVCDAMEDEAAYEDFVRLSAKDETTVADLKKAYDNFCQSQARAINTQVEATRTVLDDLRSGRASQ